MAEEGKLLYVTDRQEWRRWLQENFEGEKEVWLVYPNKSSGEPRLPYNDAVEEALCFGWIDSTIHSIDELHAAQRFSPRNPKSSYSQANKERLRWLFQHGQLHPSIENIVKIVLAEEFVFPQDILEAILKDEVAWKNYCGFSDPYKRIRIAYIDSSRKRPDEYKKRLDNFIRAARQNKKIGYGGIEKYY
ncbi:MAG TPA: YdeI/OmpD-associated family protein [Methanocella sp.]|uniref:YdeI/OmpD-associated family protein n=1 Tax=Methanocella sp. TaxID=2052833 RepID=UPI002CEF1822|nr:YdeI/OmpD-associated family protein [Methanocella sp.]HTY89763.1 YdeI/OmpD-associated family protein [Methanocella sp.]